MRRHGRARISPFHPEASGVCDRCATRWARDELQWQYDWAGESLVNKRWLVCRRCVDDPSTAYKTVFIPADPVPVDDPRPVDLTNAFAGGSIFWQTGIAMAWECNGLPVYREPGNQFTIQCPTLSLVSSGTGQFDFSDPTDSSLWALLGARI